MTSLHLDHVEHMVRHLLSLILDVTEDRFDIVVDPVLPAPLAAEIEEAQQLRRTAEAASRPPAGRSSAPRPTSR